MKVVNILGGIGNQMFQYAFMMALRTSTGIETRYDASVFKTYPLHNGFELDRRFCITARQATKEEIKKLTFYTESYFLYRIIKRLPHRRTQQFENAHCVYQPDLLKDRRSLYYYGIWQDHRYFDAYKDVVRKEFTWREPLDERNQQYYEKFVSRPTVSLHIRRGDYLKEWRYRNICELGYYQQAIEYVCNRFSPDLSFAIFSNDMKWSQEHIVPLLKGNDYTLVSWNQGADSYKDMRLMSACQYNIIANSSFSWWAAYLNIHNAPFVIAPKKWTNADVWFDRQLPEWVLIEG